MTLPDKNDVARALLAALRASLEAMARSAEDDRRGATHAENRQEGSKDMRSTEQSYVARGKAMRVEELAEQLGRFEQMALPSLGDDDPIRAGALVGLTVDDVEKVVFLAPAAAGTTVEVDGVRVTVVTPASPIGRALLGKRAGDDFELRVAGKVREHVIEGVA